MGKQPILSSAISGLSKKAMFGTKKPDMSGIAGKLLGAGTKAAGAGGGGGLLKTAMGAAGGPLGIALQVAPEIARFFTGMAQKRKAKAINPIDPGFQANTGITDNARKLNDYYSNYTMPGMSGIKSELSAGLAGAIDTATQGASSSGDLLDATTKLAYGRNSAINALGVQNAGMKENMMGQVMNANAAAGNELVRKNEFDESRYQAQLAEKAALNQASATNSFKAGDNVSALAGTALNYTSQPWSQDKIDPVMFKALYDKLKKAG